MQEKRESKRGKLDNLRGKCDGCGVDMEGEGCVDHGRRLCRRCFVGPDTIHVVTYQSFGPWSLCG